MISDVAPYNNYVGNSSTTQFDFDFYIETASQLQVILTKADGTLVTLTKDTDYSIHETGNKNGSYITYPISGSTHSALSENEILSLILTLPFEQKTEYSTSGELHLPSIEYSLDYLTRITQILNRQLQRSLKVSEGSNVNPQQMVTNINVVFDDLDERIDSVEDNIDDIEDDIEDIQDDIEDIEDEIETLQTASNIYQKKKTLTTGTIALEDDTPIYYAEPEEDTTYSISISNLTQTGKVITFELVIKQPSTAVTITLPSASWIGTEDSETAPSIDTASTTYMLVFRSFDNGSTWVGNLQGAF